MLMASDKIDSIAGVFDDALHSLVEHSGESLDSLTNGADAETLETALQQLVDILNATENFSMADKEALTSLSDEDVTSIGEHGLSFINECSEWADELDLPEVKLQFESISYPLALWIARHNGEIRTLEPIVNTLAAISNQTFDPVDLELIAAHTGLIIDATSPVIKQDLNRKDPGRPWRILNLNYGITATRSHNPDLMEESFETLVHNIPDDAYEFFHEGMEQMEALNYPDHVRHVMQKFYTEWSTSRTLH